MKIDVRANYDWVQGYLRYGHRKGVIDIPDEDFELFKQDPRKYLIKKDWICDLPFFLDDYRLEDHGNIIEVNYNIIEE